jgi:hypothetical protein
MKTSLSITSQKRENVIRTNEMYTLIIMEKLNIIKLFFQRLIKHKKYWSNKVNSKILCIKRLRENEFTILSSNVQYIFLNSVAIFGLVSISNFLNLKFYSE